MSYYHDGFMKDRKTCKNWKGKPLQYQTQMYPCKESMLCSGYIFAGADSGGTPFCYNFEEKKNKWNSLKRMKKF
jgi:hypothetical protein